MYVTVNVQAEQARLRECIAASIQLVRATAPCWWSEYACGVAEAAVEGRTSMRGAQRAHDTLLLVHDDVSAHVSARFTLNASLLVLSGAMELLSAQEAAHPMGAVARTQRGQLMLANVERSLLASTADA